MTELESRQTEFAAKYNITRDEYLKLAKALPYTELVVCLEILRAKVHKSEQRAYFAREIRRWLKGEHLGSKPLNTLDFKRATPKYPIVITLPT